MPHSLTPLDEALFASVRRGTLEEVRAALDAGANIEAVDRDTPLLAALRWNADTDVALYLIEQGARLDVVDDLGYTVLHGFAAKGLVDLARIAVARRVPVDAATSDGSTALHYAGGNDQAEMIALLVQLGASTSAVTKRDHRTALHDAVTSSCCAGTIAALVAVGCEINARDKVGETPLMLAVDVDHVEACASLLAHGADVNATSNNGDTVLIQAAQGGKLEMMRALLDGGADIDAQDKSGATALLRALDKGRFEAAWHLLNAGANPGVRNAGRCLALHYAGACATEIGLLRRLAPAHVGGVDARTNSGYTALMLYARDNHATPCGWLIELGADINARSNDGMTPILFAARTGNAALVGRLLEAGADPTQAGDDGFDLAAACARHAEVEQVVGAWRARTAMQGVLGLHAAVAVTKQA